MLILTMSSQLLLRELLKERSAGAFRAVFENWNKFRYRYIHSETVPFEYLNLLRVGMEAKFKLEVNSSCLLILKLKLKSSPSWGQLPTYHLYSLLRPKFLLSDRPQFKNRLLKLHN